MGDIGRRRNQKDPMASTKALVARRRDNAGRIGIKAGRIGIDECLATRSEMTPLSHFDTPGLICHTITRILSPHPHKELCPFASTFTAQACASPRAVPGRVANLTVPSMCIVWLTAKNPTNMARANLSLNG